eukprot:1148729-Pelagomonas_calceolata.AAC.1
MAGEGFPAAGTAEGEMQQWQAGAFLRLAQQKGPAVMAGMQRASVSTDGKVDRGSSCCWHGTRHRHTKTYIDIPGLQAQNTQ